MYIYMTMCIYKTFKSVLLKIKTYNLLYNYNASNIIQYNHGNTFTVVENNFYLYFLTN